MFTFNGIAIKIKQKKKQTEETLSTTIDIEKDNSHLATQFWDGSYLLAKFIERHCLEGKFSLENSLILELGSGCGLSGIVASLFKPKHVLLTDLGENLDHLQMNVDMNRAEQKNRNSGISFNNVTVQELAWGNIDHLNIAVEFASKMKKQTTIESSNAFDVILGSDIIAGLYDVNALLTTLVNLSNPDTKIFISYRARPFAKEQIFFKKAKEMFDIIEVVSQ